MRKATSFTSQEIWKWHDLLRDVHHTLMYKNFSLVVNLRTNSYFWWWQANTQSTTWWCMVICQGSVMSPFIFPPGLNGEAYIKYLENHAPCHRSRSQFGLLQHHHTPNIWPPDSPDSNLLDNYLWGAAKRERNKTPCNIKDEQKARIKATFTNSNKVTVGKVYRRFRSHL